MAQQVLSFPASGSTTNRFAGIRVADLTTDEADSVIALALSVLARKHRRGATLTSPEATRSYLRLEIGERHNELFGVLFLDLCAALDNVELGHPDSEHVRIGPEQLHINQARAGASS